MDQVRLRGKRGGRREPACRVSCRYALQQPKKIPDSRKAKWRVLGQVFSWYVARRMERSDVRVSPNRKSLSCMNLMLHFQGGPNSKISVKRVADLIVWIIGWRGGSANSLREKNMGRTKIFELEGCNVIFELSLSPITIRKKSHDGFFRGLHEAVCSTPHTVF